MLRMQANLAFVAILGVLLPAAAAQAVLHITPSAGYSITWNGNDGAFFNPAVPALVPANLASTGVGTTPFATSQLAVGPHFTPTINDGQYGNSNSWIGADGDPVHAIGVAFTGLRNVTSVAWGRDNGNAVTDPTSGGQPLGQLADRTPGVYTLQRTTVAAPGVGTGVTGNAATGWETIGTFNYYGNFNDLQGGGFTQWYRHEYQISLNGGAVQSTGLRLVVPQTGIGVGTAIDEVEAYAGSALGGLNLVSVSAPGVVPNNVARSSNGSVAFAKDIIAGGALAPTHTIANLNDGVYGNSNSWIGDSNPTFAGVAFAGPTLIDQIAWGRDSDGSVTFADRAAGVYIVEFTTVANPNALTSDASWQVLGSATLATNDPNRFIRHLYSFNPVLATGIRIRTQNGEGQIAIDEIEVFAAQGIPEPATMSLLGFGVLLLGRRTRRNEA